MLKNVILITGSPCSGKDTLFRMIKEINRDKSLWCTVSSREMMTRYLLKDTESSLSKFIENNHNFHTTTPLVEEFVMKQIDNCTSENLVINDYPRTSQEVQNLKSIVLRKNICLKIVCLGADSDRFTYTHITSRELNVDKPSTAYENAYLDLRYKQWLETLDSLSQSFNLIRMDNLIALSVDQLYSDVMYLLTQNQGNFESSHDTLPYYLNSKSPLPTFYNDRDFDFVLPTKSMKIQQLVATKSNSKRIGKHFCLAKAVHLSRQNLANVKKYNYVAYYERYDNSFSVIVYIDTKGKVYIVTKDLKVFKFKHSPIDEQWRDTILDTSYYYNDDEYNFVVNDVLCLGGNYEVQTLPLFDRISCVSTMVHTKHLDTSFKRWKIRYYTNYKKVIASLDEQQDDPNATVIFTPVNRSYRMGWNNNKYIWVDKRALQIDAKVTSDGSCFCKGKRNDKQLQFIGSIEKLPHDTTLMSLKCDPVVTNGWCIDEKQKHMNRYPYNNNLTDPSPLWKVKQIQSLYYSEESITLQNFIA